jgi:uncharacterized protein YwqG
MQHKILWEQILDLGDLGIVALALDSFSQDSFNANGQTYAWHYQEKRERIDVSALFTRRSTIEAANAGVLREIDSIKKSTSVDAKLIAQNVQYLETQLVKDADCFLELPSFVSVFPEGKVLILFNVRTKPDLFRLVDLKSHSILSEETVPDLCRRYSIRQTTKIMEFDVPVTARVEGGNGEKLLVNFDDKPTFAMTLNGATIVLSRFHWLSYFAMTKTLVFKVKEDKKQITFRTQVDSKTDLAVYNTQIATRHGFKTYQAQTTDRVVLMHSKHIIEVIDEAGAKTKSYQLLPKSKQEYGAELILSPDARYALLRDDEHNLNVVIDIETNQRAEIDVPNKFDGDHEAINRGKLSYITTAALNGFGCYTIVNEQLHFTPYSTLSWQSLSLFDPKARVRKTPPSKPFLALTDSFKRPTVRLTLGKKITNSKLYGDPRIASLDEWPMHDEAPMLLLCELDLADLAAAEPATGLPSSGALSVYIALDPNGDEGEVLIDDEFNPVDVWVTWVASFTVKPLQHPDLACYDPEWISFKKDKGCYPQPDDLQLEVANLSEDVLAEYAEFIDEKLPDGASAGHRVGGYPHLIQNNDFQQRAFYKRSGREPSSLADWRVAAGWRLLLQLDSDDAFMWGTDSGMLYLMIHEVDLKQLDFSNVVALTDGY